MNIGSLFSVSYNFSIDFIVLFSADAINVTLISIVLNKNDQ